MHALETLGVCATTTRGGVGMKGKADLSPLYGARINAVVDKDGAGDNWARYMSTMLEGKARTLTFVQAEIGKDAADHIAATADSATSCRTCSHQKKQQTRNPPAAG